MATSDGSVHDNVSHSLHSLPRPEDALEIKSEQPPPIPHPDVVYLEPTTSERIADNLFLVITLVLATAIWLMALVSQAVVTAQQSNATARTAWFGLILQLFLILLAAALLLTTYLPPYHIQISTLAALVVVFAVLAADANIYTPNTPAQRATAAAWLVTALIDILWVLYFSSPPHSPIVHLVHSLGPAPDATFKSAGAVEANNNARSVHRQSRPISGASTMELGPLRHSAAGHSQNRVLSGIQESATSGVGSGNRTTVSAADTTDGNTKPRFSLKRDKELVQQEQEPVAPNTTTGSSSVGPVIRAEALFGYTAAKEDPGELTFKKGDIIEILDRSGKWWEGRRADGSTGIAPSNYLRIID